MTPNEQNLLVLDNQLISEGSMNDSFVEDSQLTLKKICRIGRVHGRGRMHIL